MSCTDYHILSRPCPYMPHIPQSVPLLEVHHSIPQIRAPPLISRVLVIDI